MSQDQVEAVDTATWRMFRVRVGAVRQLSPSFVRVTLTGDDLADFADLGYDVRIKLVLPLGDLGFEHLSMGRDWYTAWRELPDDQRNPLRTYTARTVRAEQREVDVDVVRHGDDGPASKWVNRAQVGDELCVVGPNVHATAPHGGVEWHPPADMPGCRYLLAADETAVPAVLSILERLPDTATGVALLEVPVSGDVLEVAAPKGVEVVWLPRDGGVHGDLLVPAVTSWLAGDAGDAGAAAEAVIVDETTDDGDEHLVWEVPTESAPTDGLYAWLAGEAGVVKQLRRHLVTDLGIDRRSVAFMGYWRRGASES